MCGSRDTFASKGPQVVKWFAGGAPVKPNDVQWISGAEFKRAFPSEARGFSYDFMKLIPVVDNRDYAVGSIGSSVRPITRRVIFVDTDKPTKCGAMCRNAKGPMCDCSCKGENHGASVAMSRARFAELDLKPTAEMAANAARGLELREKHGKGGTAVGVARARDIKNRANLSPSTVKRMHSFFSRHEGNQKGGEDDAGYIAWLLWGGDAGKAWAARKSEQIDKSESARFSHDIRLPKGKRRLNIDEAHAALAQMGYKLGTVRYDPAAGGSVYKVTQPNGSVVDMPAAKLTDFIYQKAQHMRKQLNSLPVPTIANPLNHAEHGAAALAAINAAIKSGNGSEARRLFNLYAHTLSSGEKSAAWASIRKMVGIGANFSRTGAKAAFSSTPHKITYTDKSGKTHTYMVSDKILRDMNGTKRYAEASGAKPDFESLLRIGEKMGQVVRASRTGEKAAFAKWEETQTKKNGEPITEYTATVNGVAYMIEKPQRMATDAKLFVWDELRGMQRIASGTVADLKAKAESMGKREARGVANIERIANYSRNGAKAAFGLERSINIMLSDAKIPDSAFDWKNGFLIVDPEYHDRIVEVLKGYIPWELKSLPRIRKEQMSRTGAKAAFGVEQNSGKYTLILTDVPNAPKRTFNTLREARNYHDAHNRGLAARILSPDLGIAAEKSWGGEWEVYFSRTGAKSTHAANNVDLWNFLWRSDTSIARQNKKDFDTLKKYAQMALTLPDFTPPTHAQHGPSLHTMASDFLREINAWENQLHRYRNRAPWNASRLGAKSTHAADHVEESVNYLLRDIRRAIDKKDIAKARRLHSDALRIEGHAAGSDAGPLPSWIVSELDDLTQELKALRMSRAGAKSDGLTLAQRIAVEHDAKRMANR
jgi:hypothetical protein